MSGARSSTRRFETFSYLPPLGEEEIAAQIEHILKLSLVPSVEYTIEPAARTEFWSMWKLPLFEARTATDVLKEIEACARANPVAFVKLNGYDPRRQGQIVSFVVRRPK